MYTVLHITVVVNTLYLLYSFALIVVRLTLLASFFLPSFISLTCTCKCMYIVG